MRRWAKLAAAGLLGGILGLLAGLPARATTSADPTIQRAADLVEWGRLKEARSLLAAAVADPGNARNAPLIGYYSHLLAKFGDLRGGMSMAKRAVALDDRCAACHLYLFEAMADRAKTVSQFRALLQLPKMKKQLQKATDLDPNSGDVQWGWIDLDLALPSALGGSPADALKHADRLAQIDPVDGHLARASIYESTHKPDLALAEYRAAAVDHPNDPRGIFALGQALYARKDYAAAAPQLTRALALNPQSALYSGYQAANLVQLQHRRQAQQVLEAAAKLHPDSRLGAYLVAQALHDTGQDFDWAKQLLGAYMAMPPEPEQPTLAQAQKLWKDVSGS
ncbi:MAG TPA: tetratricopeptide repeat protein [Terriglobales bacterium]|nr:tetratricopeptide repeat protein [Terriglobales bacterium]